MFNCKLVGAGQPDITLAFISEKNLVVDSTKLSANEFELYVLTRCENSCVSLLKASEKLCDSGNEVRLSIYGCRSVCGATRVSARNTENSVFIGKCRQNVQVRSNTCLHASKLGFDEIVTMKLHRTLKSM